MLFGTMVFHLIPGNNSVHLNNHIKWANLTELEIYAKIVYEWTQN